MRSHAVQAAPKVLLLIVCRYDETDVHFRVFVSPARAPCSIATRNSSTGSFLWSATIMRMEERPPTVWFEVENILQYFQLYPVPTGIQRVCLEIFAEGHQLSGDGLTIKFCRLNMFSGRFQEVTFEQITEAYKSSRAQQAPWQIFPLRRSLFREWRTLLSAAVNFPAYAFRVLSRYMADILKLRMPGDENKLSPGDVIVAVGSSWVILGFCNHVEASKNVIAKSASFRLSMT